MIGVDCDGPLLNWGRSFRSYVRSKHGIELSAADMMHNPVMTAPGLLHLPKQVLDGLVDDYCCTHPADLEDADAPEALRSLSDRGHELRLVTHRTELAKAHTLALLGRHGITFQAHVFGWHRPKVGYDVLIDDTLRHLETNLASGGLGILYTQDHNAHQGVPRGVVRTDTWSEIPRLIDELLAVA
jgi:hypothetical protein